MWSLLRATNSFFEECGQRMNPIRLISGRYLFSGKKISLISILTFISIAGITLGTALLIAVLSVFNGFYEVIQEMLLAFDPDIRIESAEGRMFYYDEDLATRVENIPEVVATASYLEGKSMLVFRDDRNEVVTVRGVDRESFLEISDLESSMNAGVLGFSVQNNRPGLVISDQLRSRLLLNVDDDVALLSAAGMQRALTQLSTPRNIRFNVRGSYSMIQIVDIDLIYVDLVAAQRLFNARNRISGLDVKLTDTNLAASVKMRLQEELGPEFTVSTWYDLQKPLYDVMYLEKWGSYFILMIIVIVAVLNIIGSLTMIVIQKRRDIGLLMSFGLSSKAIRKIFRLQGLYIGLIGCGLGGIIGFLLTWLQEEYSLLKLSSAFIIDAYPVAIHMEDVILVLAGSMFLSLAASWYPARKASEVQPANALRDE